ncbi:MAG: hypothetical protein ACT4O2_14290 [Beijerinckiaceae bacterium]
MLNFSGDIQWQKNSNHLGNFAVGAALSLEEIGAWIKMQSGVKSVRLAEYARKSHPPQREFILEAPLRGELRELIVNVFVEGGGRFRFNYLREVLDALDGYRNGSRRREVAYLKREAIFVCGV